MTLFKASRIFSNFTTFISLFEESLTVNFVDSHLEFKIDNLQ